MARKQIIAPRIEFMTRVALSFVFLWSSLDAREVLRVRATPSTATTSTPGTGAPPATTEAAVTNAREHLIKTKDVLDQVNRMQQAARDLAKGATGPNGLNGLPAVDPKSWNLLNGLKPSGQAWTGANKPVGSDGKPLPDGSADVTIVQTEQQALLHWETFNIGKDTTLNFDQSKGGANVNQWVAFNQVGVTGSPSQILGAINAQGQVYVINPNGIIFGGSSRVNTHALVASSLPINERMISQGLLNNPDRQFLFSALPQAGGATGPTDAFAPVMVDEYVSTSTDHVLKLKPAADSSPSVSFVSASATPVTLIADTDYTLSPEGTDGRMKVSFTAEGLLKKPSGTTIVHVAYTPRGDQYGNVEVQAGAMLTAPTNADHVGGRVALVGPNVTNAGTISTPNGQTILAAGLQVGFDASKDPGLRGLTTFVGAVTDPALDVTDDDGAVTNTGTPAGTVTNGLDRTHASAAALTYTKADGSTGTIAAGTPIPGLIDGRRADGSIADVAVTLVGKAVNQLGVIDSTTSVALNGRVDLLAEYNAFANPKGAVTYQSKFVHDTTETTPSTGIVTLGAESVTRILPDLASTERIVGSALALPSQINLRGQSIHLAGGSASATTGAIVLAPSGRVAVDAGQWSALGASGSGTDSFLHTNGQVYLDAGTAIDVAGSQDVAASVKENIVSVELRGPQLADFPSQRDGALRGQTVQVDLRQVGNYNGRSWIGTPLADASGYAALAQHTVGQLTTAGGSVKINAGDSVVMNPTSAINVSGGWINYQGGDIETTKVLSDGKIFDIAQATPDRIYSGIYSGISTTTDPKWGVTTSTSTGFSLKTHEEGYVQGGSGGSVAITAPAMVLDGNLSGRTVAGERQRTTAGQLAKTYANFATTESTASMRPIIQSALAVPTGSSLDLSFEQEYFLSTQLLTRSPTPPKIVFTTTGPAQSPVEAFPNGTTEATAASLGKRGLKGAEIDLKPDLFSTANSTGAGFTSLAVKNGDGDIRIGTNLTLAPGGSLSLDAANITIADNLAVTSPGGSLTFAAHNFSPYDYQAQRAANEVALAAPDDLRGRFQLGKGATLSTAGRVVDDRAGRSDAGTAGFFTNGYRFDANGTEVDAVSIRAYRLDLGDDSKIDVSGGVAASTSGKLTYGGAGRISLLGVLDPQGTDSLPIGQNPDSADYDATLRGWLRFNPAKVRFMGYAGAGAKSGSLALQAQQIQIESPAARADPKDKDLLSPANLDPTGTLLLSPDFFGRDGIGNYSLTGLGSVARDATGKIVKDTQGPGRLYVPGVYVAPDLGKAGLATAVTVQPRSWVTTGSGSVSSPLALTPSTDLLPVGARAAGSLVLATPGLTFDKTLFVRGDLKLGTGSSITLDPKASVSLSGNTVQVDGAINAPAGNITVKGGDSYLVTSDLVLANPVLATVELGANSRFNVKGVAVGPAGLAPNTGILGNINTGAVLAGGNISVQGNIAARKGAELDVSGSAGTLDLLANYQDGASTTGIRTTLVATAVQSDAGSITLKGSEVLVSNATLLGAAGGATAQGGRLSISSNSFKDIRTPADANLEVTQTGPSLSTGFGSLLGKAFVDAKGAPIASLGHFAVSDFWNSVAQTSVGGMTELTLGGNVRFAGAVDVSAGRSLTVGTGGFIYSSAGTGTATSQAMRLAAPTVTLGLPLQAPVATAGGTTPQVDIFRDGAASFYIAPTPGAGTLDVQAESLISLGSVSFQGISDAAFNTQKEGKWVAGDLRGNGVVDIAGSLDFRVGQIYAPTATNFTLAAYDFQKTDGTTQAGSITINPVLDSAGKTLLPPVPLAAGSVLTLYASKIKQGGVLRAPFGTINLGWNGVGTPPNSVAGSPGDLITGNLLPLPVTETLTLSAGSQTSVSAVDPQTGKAVTIPYGYSTDGANWFDPTGTDITTLGPPAKNVALSAESVLDEKGSVIDISGGGDLYAYRWIPGVGGNRDVLASTYVPNPSAPSLASFAVLPGYGSGFAPYGAFGSQASQAGFEGYVAGSSLAVGDRVHLDLGDGQGARDYTLLPARYALLSGAYLVTPVTGAPPEAPITQPDGAKLVAGYRTNTFSPVQGTAVLSAFEVALGTSASTAATAPKSIVRARSQYTDFFGNTLFAAGTTSDTPLAWRLPKDAGYLRLTSATGGTIKFDGDVAAGVQSTGGGRGGLIDISSPNDILITNSQTAAAEIGTLTAQLALVDPLVLTAATLTKFGAESLLVGGYRSSSADGAAVTVTTNRIAVANEGEVLSGSDVILAAKTSLELADKAAVSATGTLAQSDKLVFGQLDASGNAVAGSGNGTLLRVSSDPAAQILRQGANQTTPAELAVGSGVKLSAPSGTLILDSTNATVLDSTAVLTAGTVALDSGQISIQFPDAGNLRLQANGKPTTGLILTGTTLDALQSSGAALSLLSYSSLDFYGSGELGKATASSLALHAPEIFGDGGTVTVRAKNIILDNNSKSAAPDAFAAGAEKGSLRLVGDTVNLGVGTVQVERYGKLTIDAATAVNFSGNGALATEGSATITTPLLTGATAAEQKISAAGALTLTGTPGTTGGTGLGAKLTLEGTSVDVGSHIQLSSGALTLHATGPATAGDVTVTGKIDVSGTAKKFYDLPKYTNGGQVSLTSDHGDIVIDSTGSINVSGAKTDVADTAHAGLPYASAGGVLSVASAQGKFSLEGEVTGHGIAAGEGASLTLDTGSVAADGGTAGSLASLAAALGAGGFDRAQNIRVRNGDVTVDGDFKAHNFSLSADNGSINVTGGIDARGATGGIVSLAARGGVTVDTDASIDASADHYDNAGKGGSVQLEAGTSKFDVSGNALTPSATAAVDLRGSVDVTVGVESIPFAAGASLYFPTGVAGGNKVVFSAPGQYRQSDGKVVTVAAGVALSLPAGSTAILSAAGTVTLAGNGKGGSVPVELVDGRSLRLRPEVGTAAASAAILADASLGLNSGTVHLRAPQLDSSGQPIPVGADPTLGSDVAVRPITGKMSGASSVVVEGYRVFTPVAGVIDTVKSAVLTNGTSFASQAGTVASPGPISTRLLSGQADPSALAAVLHLRPGAEIVNAAASGTSTVTTLTAGTSTSSSSLLLQSGGSVTLSALAAATGKITSTTGSGRVFLPDGAVTAFTTASKNVALPAGSKVVMDAAGVLTLNIAKSGAAAGSGTLRLDSGAKLTSTAGGTLDTGNGTAIEIKSGSLKAVAATSVVLLNGGAVSTVAIAAGASYTPPAGSTVVLAQGSYQFTGSTVINPAVGDLRLDGNWDLAPYRYAPAAGATGEPGMLTLRAAGNLYFNGALSDGFASAAYDAPLLSAGAQSTSYRLVAGADLTAADFQKVQSLASLGIGTGSVLIGQNGVGQTTAGDAAKTSEAVAGHFQVVRTGTGDITVAAGRDVLLLNPFATIYTAGTKVADATLGGTFDEPVLNQDQNADGGKPLGTPQQSVSYPAQFTLAGGNVAVVAQADIAHKSRDTTGRLIEDSEQQLPNNWIYRRGLVDPATGRFFQGTFETDSDGKVHLVADETGEVKSTAWWVDFSNFFEGIGALGGGNVTLNAGRDVLNVDAVAPTNARMAGKDAKGDPLRPDMANLVELGGGDVSVTTGRDINGGVYYVERGNAELTAGRSVLTNSTRTFDNSSAKAFSENWLPTTLLLGKGNVRVRAASDLRLGPVANVFLLPAGISNTVWNKTYFSTFDSNDEVEVSSLTGSVGLSESSSLGSSSVGMLYTWLKAVPLFGASSSASFSKPWLRLNENSMEGFRTNSTSMTSLSPGTLKATAFTGSLSIAGDLNLSPSSTGTLELVAQGTISSLSPIKKTNSSTTWGYGTIRLLDSAPSAVPGPESPLATVEWAVGDVVPLNSQGIYSVLNGQLVEGESTDNDSLPTKLSRHGSGPLHASDQTPLRVYSAGGDITGISLLAGKSGKLIAADDMTDISIMLQNNRASDVSIVEAGRDLLAFAPNSAQRQTAVKATPVLAKIVKSGLIEIGGPGSLEVLAGRNLDLGVDPSENKSPGIVSVGSARNPNLPFGGADVVAAAGLGSIYTSAAAEKLQAPGLLSSRLAFPALVENFLKAGTVNGTRYLPLLGAALGLPVNTPNADIASAVTSDSLTEKKAQALLDVFYLILRQAARDRNDPVSPDAGTYTKGFDAIAALFPGSPKPTEDDLKSTVPVVRPASPWTGSLSLSTKQIKTVQGGDISLLVPGGEVTVGRATDKQSSDQGILTQRGGGISIFSADSVNVGTSRIFTLRGGDEILWSTWGNIAAGSGSKTVFSAPPTRVLIDAQSGDVQNDLAGLATGAGIGVLATLAGVDPGDVDLIAPVGTIDAGDAGIRSSGNLNIAARVVLNAGNIQVGGSSAGTPPPVSPPSLSSLPPPPDSSKEKNETTEAEKQRERDRRTAETPSIIMVEVLGYGGGDDDAGTSLKSDEEKKKEEDDEEDAKKKKKNSVETSVEETIPASP